ncbi:helix-turn-helix domain-containing protein [Microbacterium sp. A8/3-1]|uniref:Helix-turn-helix domain-containing protein n=1 Tax=Microbacterium sp. A8/3-1 TaxID=3160749 RepID=A0AAU7VSY7_9MICO
MPAAGLRRARAFRFVRLLRFIRFERTLGAGGIMSTVVRSRRSVDPVSPSDSEGIAGLARFIEREADEKVKPRLVGPDGESIELPDEVYEILVRVTAAMRAGNAVSVVPYSMRVSTQEAAEMLGVSRPTFVRMLERDEIPYEQPGRHRRIKLADVIAFRDRSHVRAIERLDALVAEGSADGLYDVSQEEYVKALRAAKKRSRSA